MVNVTSASAYGFRQLAAACAGCPQGRERHQALVRAADLTGGRHKASATSANAPTILQRSEQNFLPAVLEELTRFDPAARASLAASVAHARAAGNVLKLFHPVQRTFHVALVNLVCDRTGNPRLDPRRVESAGLVVRRLWRDEEGKSHPGTFEGWRQDGARVAGWVRFGSRLEEDLDPEPARRRGPTGHTYLDGRLAFWQNAVAHYSERTSPMFVAPPETCRSAGQTIVHGVIPTASAERVEPVPDGAPREQFPLAEMRRLFSPLLGATRISHNIPAAGCRARVKAGEGGDLEAQNQQSAVSAQQAESRPWYLLDDTAPVFRTYTDMLRQLALELDAWGSSAEARALCEQLSRIQLPVRPAGRAASAAPDLRPASQLLRQHYEVLVRRARRPERRAGESWAEYPAVEMPVEWPAVPEQLVAALATAAKRVLDARLAMVPRNAGRYDDLSARYCLRVFIRLRPEGECPGKLVWSAYSEPFAIAPWYDPAGVPPVPIPLPEPSTDFLKSLKPNVSFLVPGKLADFLQKNDPKKLLKGEGSEGSGALGFVCGFNIPIITICAFILLSVVLGLLDIFLGWLAFVKICIPIPRPSSSSSSGSGS